MSVRSRGLSLIEVLLGITLLVIFSTGIYFAFQTLLTVLKQSQDRQITTAVLNERAEFIRNLPYASVGVVGGVPAGILPASASLTRNGQTFTIESYVRNIDDPFDGVVGGIPNDTAPADYKLVELRATCASCRGASTAALTFRTAPRGLETSSQNGSLFVNVFDANGVAISGANVTIVNNQTSPAININDITNVNGMYQLVDTPTSTTAYRITVGKVGYSSERTYQPGLPGNPNPVKLDSTVATGQLTSISFSIDKLGFLTLNSSNMRCSPVGSISSSLQGTKLIGISPDVYKYSSTSVTSAEGTRVVPLEWDTYTNTFTDSAYYLAGMIPYGTITVNPSSNVARQLVVSAAVPSGVLATIISATSGAPIVDATANLVGGVEDRTVLIGYSSASDTAWVAGNYITHDGFLDPDSAPGTLKLLQTDGLYPTSTPHSLVSKTIDFGANNVSITSFDWQMVSEPAQTSIKFQLAGNNDNATWLFIGPDGTSNTYFTSTSTLNNFSNTRYLRYKVYLTTDSELATPILDSVSFIYKGGCVPSNQALFSGLAGGEYVLTVNAPHYAEAQANVVVGPLFQEVVVSM